MYCAFFVQIFSLEDKNLQENKTNMTAVIIGDPLKALQEGEKEAFYSTLLERMEALAQGGK